MRRTYSQEQRDKALVVCAELGQAEAARQLGIPKGTVCWWAHKAGIKSHGAEKTRAATETCEARVAAKRATLKERLLDEAHYCLDAIHNEHIDFKSAGPAGPVEVTFPVAPAAAVQHYATALAIFIDKFRLESGEVTGREEKHVHEYNQSELDRELAELCSEMARREERAGCPTGD